MMKYLAIAKILKKRRPSVDNMVLHLHYRITFLIFFIGSTLVMAKEYFGKNIMCLKSNAIPQKVLEIYCFIFATFSVPNHYDKEIGNSVAHHGVGNLYEQAVKIAANPEEALDNIQPSEVVYHSYYQWVALVLFLQAMMFYTPRFLWKNCELGLFNLVLSGLENPEADASNRKKQCSILSKYMKKSLHLHNFYAISFFACEALAFAIVVGNIFLTNYFLGGTFLTYGSDVINLVDGDQINRTDPMSKLFPTVTKCTFHDYGASGSPQSHDTMCLLTQNIFNQKLYVLIWFWLILLAVVTGLWLLYRVATIVLPAFRFWLLKSRAHMIGDIPNIERQCQIGDWFLLHQLGRVIEPTVFAEFLRELNRELDTTPNGEDMYPMLEREKMS